MNDALRKERIGLAHAAALLKVPISQLRLAIETDNHLFGKPLPTPLVRNAGSRRNQMLWELGDLMDFQEECLRG